ncbi:MAG: hypothetical protein HND53_00945 [Proteobacteria bacterium]|nr:hypothetical protein [Pseudomonadota bacterium]NOG59040.1 hypothetical protein [Pseudomonadota bacterium]
MKQKRKTGKQTKIKSSVFKQAQIVRPTVKLNPVTSFIRTSLPAGLLFGLSASGAFAAEVLPNFNSGNSTISHSNNGNHADINSPTANGFGTTSTISIGAQQTVNILQNQNAHYTLNSTSSGALPEQILGSLNSVGNVTLFAQNGIVIGQGATVNVNSLVATSLKPSDNEGFQNGNHTYVNPDGSEGGLVVNRGTIQAATGGSVSLIGGAVSNEGTILATAGQVNLVAGKKVTMDFDGDGLMQFAIDEEVLQNTQGLESAVSNSGTINSGSVLLKGSAAKDVFTNVVNNSGVIGASKIDNSGGTIKLVASGSSNSLINTGTLNASSDSGDGGTIEIYASDTAIISEDALLTAVSSSDEGGKIQITGDKVALLNNSAIDASGEKGGGEILIGGDYQGNNSAIQNASLSYVGENTSIKADAINDGDGGKVIVWADDTTAYLGEISATGGTVDGDGGFVEVSGKENLIFLGSADTTAQNGETGTLLLDPTDIDIGAVAYSGSTASLLAFTNNAGGTGDNIWSTLEDAGSQTISTADVVEILTGTSLILQATNNITLSAALDYNGIGTSTLTLAADNNINITGGSITDGTAGGDTLNLTLNADADGSGAGDLTISQTIETNGGTLNLVAEDFIITGAINTGAGNIFIAEDQLSGPLTFGDEFSQAEVDLFNTSGTITFGRATDASGSTITMVATSFQDGTDIDFTSGAADLNVAIIADTTIQLGNDSGTDATADTITATSLTIGGGGTVTQGTAFADTITGTNLTFQDGGTVTLGSNTNNYANLSATGTSNVTYTDADAVDIAAGGFAAASLNLTTVAGNITDTGTATITGTTTLNSGAANNITLDSTGNDFQGNVTVTNSNNLTIDDANGISFAAVTTQAAADIDSGGAVDFTGVATIGTNLDVDTNANGAGGTITDTGGQLLVTGSTTLDATASNNIVLDNAANDFDVGGSGDALIVTNANALTIDDANALVLGAVTTAAVSDIDTGGAVDFTGVATIGTDLNVDTDANGAGGAITDTGGQLLVTGSTTLDAAAANNITLDNTANDFDVGNSGDALVVTNANALTVDDANAITFGAVTTQGAADIDAGGNVTFNAVASFGSSLNVNSHANAGTGALIHDNGGTGQVTVQTTTTLDSGTSNIGLTNTANDFDAANGGNALTITSAVSVSLDDTDSITFGAVTTTSGMDVDAGGFVDFSGLVTVSSLDVNATANGAGGAITDTGGQLDIATSLTLNAGAANNITLDNAANDVDGNVTVTNANNLTIDGTDSLQFAAVTTAAAADIDTAGTVTFTGATSIGTTLNVDTDVNGGAGAAITDSGAGQLTIGGIATLDAGATANLITLDNTSNDFQANVVVVNSSNLSIDDTNGVSFGTVTTTGSADIDADGAITFTGVTTIGANLDVDADANNTNTGGDITDTGAGRLLVTGTTSLSADTANDIALDAVNNDFDVGNSGDAVTVVDANDVTLVDANQMAISSITSTAGNVSASTLAGALTVLSSGPVNVVTTTGGGTVTLSATGGNLIVNDGVSSVNGKVTLASAGAGNDVVLGADGDVSTTSGEIEVNAADAITMDTDTVFNAGDDIIDLNATTGSITLGQVTTTSNSTTGGSEAVNISTGGAVIDANAGTNNITTGATGALVIDAVSGVGSADAIETSVGSLDLDNTGSNNVLISEANAITLTKVDNAGTGTTTSVVTTGAGTMQVVTVDAAAANAIVTLTTNDGAITDDGVDSTLSSITADGGGTANINITAGGNNDIGATGAATPIPVEYLDINNTGTPDLNVTITGGQDVFINFINGAVTSSQLNGSIVGAGTVNSINLGVTNNTFTFDDNTFGIVASANAFDFDLRATAINLNFDNATDIDVKTSGTVKLQATAGAIEDAAADVNLSGLDIIAGTIDLDATAGIGNADEITIRTTNVSADSTANNVDIDSLATAGVTATSLTTGTGTITFDQTGGQTLGVTSATTTAGDITITNDNANLTATTVTAGGADGDVILTTTTGGNVLLGSVTGSGATGSIAITSAAAITDATANDAIADVIGVTTSLSAASGIGQGANASIDVNTSTLTSATSGTNGIAINLLNDAAAVAGLGANHAVTASLVDATTSGNITITGSAGSGTRTYTLVDTNAGTISVAATAGDMALGVLTAGTAGTANTVNVTATAGAITDNANDAVPDVIGSAVTLSASTGIGQGANGSIDVNTTTLTSATSATGGIDINLLQGAANGLTANHTVDVTLVDATTSGNITLTGTSGSGQRTYTLVDTNNGTISASSAVGNMVLGVLTAGTGGTANTVNVTTSLGGIIDDADDATADIIGSTATLSATTRIGVINGSIDLNVNTVTSATSATGGISLNLLNSAVATNGLAANHTTTVTLADATTAGNITLTGTAGSGARTYTLVDTNNGTISATATTGNMVLGQLTAGTNGTARTVSVTATAGAITDNASDATADLIGSTVILNASTGIGQGANGSIDVNTNTLTNATSTTGGIDINLLNDAVAANGLTGNHATSVTLIDATTSGNITLTGTTGSGLRTYGTTRIDTNNGTISASATAGNMALGLLTSGTGGTLNTVDVTATAGSITDATSDAAVDIIGSTGTLSATTGIGSAGGAADIDTTLTTLVATNNTSGNIVIQETNGLIIGGTGVRTLAGNGNVNIDVDAGVLTANSVVTAHGSGTVTLNTDAGTVGLNAAVSSTTGQIDITGDSINQNAGGNISTTTGAAVNVTADNGAITMANGTTTSTTGAGIATYSATTDVALSALSSGSGAINVTADSDTNNTGAITDISAAETANLTTTGTATLVAAQGIGATGAADIDTTIGTLVATNSTTGDIFVQDTANLIIAGTGVRTLAGNGNINVDTAGTLNVNSVVTANGAGTVTLTSGGLLTANAAISSTSGAISLTGVGVTSTAAGVVNSGSGTILVDGTAGAINLGGALTTTSVSGTAVTVRDATTVSLADVTTGVGATGTVILGVGGDITGAVTQTGIITTNTLTGNTASTITLGGNNVITNLGTFTSNGAFALNDNAAGLNVTGAIDNTTGTASISTTGGVLAIGAGIDVAGFGLTLTGVGVTQSAGTILSSTANVTAGAGVITLTQGTNNFTGAVALSNSGNNNVQITDVDALDFGVVGVGTGTFTANAVGITQTGGAFTQAAGAGAATFNAGAGVITLTQGANNFIGAVSLNNSGANNVSITDVNALDFGTSSVGSGTFTANAVGITQTGGAITQAAGAGATAFNAGAGVITLTQNANDFTGTVSLSNSGANAVTVNDANSLTVGTINVGQNLVLNVDRGADDAAILDLSAATLTVGGTSTVNGQGTNDTLIGSNTVNTWTVSALNTGTLNNSAEVITFNNFGSLTGNANTDNFVFTGGSLSGNVDGQAGTNTLNYAALAGPISVTVNALGGTTGFAGAAGSASQIIGTIDDITDLTGSAGTDTFTGRDSVAAFEIDGSNRYCDAGAACAGRIINLSSVENLTGGSAADTYTVTANHTGNLTGGNGDNIFNFANVGAGTGLTGNVVTGTGADTFNFGTPTGAPPGTNRYTIIGSLDGGNGADAINYSGSALNETINITGAGSTDGSQGTFTGNAGDAALISAGFDNINSFTGNGLGTFTGPNVNTFWNITGANSGTYGTTLALIGANTFANFDVVAGSANDVFVFQNNATARIAGGINGGGGTNTLAGSLGVDTFTITGGTSVTITPAGGAGATNLTNINNIDGTNATDDGTTTVGDSGADVFAINQNWTGSLNGFGGNDTFTFADTRTVGGSLTGGTGTDIINWNAYTTARNIVLTASTADGYTGTEASITGGFVTVDDVRGSTTGGQTDQITGQNAVSTWTVNGGGTQYTTGGFNLAFSNIENLLGGSNVDNFNVTGVHTGNLSGGAGADNFDIDATLTGAIDGEVGADVLQGNLITAVTLTGSDADGFAGTEADVTANFDGIQVLTGTNATLTGVDAVSTFNITGGNSGTFVSTNTLTFSGVQNVTGGTNNDTFSFTNAGSLTGAVNGGTGTNTIIGDADGNAFDVTGADSGTLTGKTSGWSNIANLTGGVAADTFLVSTGTLSGLIDGAGNLDGDSATFNPAITVTLNGTNTGVSRVETVDMTSDGVLVGTAGTSTWNLNAAAGGTVNDGTTTVTFSNTPTVRSGSGTNVFTANGTFAGVVNLTSSDNTWNHTPGQTLTTGSVTGSGALTIPGSILLTPGTNLTIGGGDLVLPTVTGFTGHLIIGGELTTAGASPFTSAIAVQINVETLDVTTAINTGGELTLLAGNIDLNANITAGDTIGMIAAGAIVNAGLPGDITANPGGVILNAPDAQLIASNDIVNSTDITLNFAGGEVDVAKGNTDELEFNGGSNFVDAVTDPDFESFVTASGNGNLYTTPILANVNITGLSITQAFSINPASSLIGLETLAFIDVGLFEEELQLYGVIGTGIALALAQCEEQEGCAPNISEDELNNLINSLEARLLELERRLAEEPDANLRAKLEELIEGFNDELRDFRGYRQELQDFFAAEEEEEDFDEEELDDEDDLLDREVDEGEVERLAKVLETVKARIEWLESLKANPDERARLSKATGIELTQEALETIIEGAKSEAAFIENQIKLLIEGTEAMLDGKSTPMFTAEAHDYNSIQTLHYGSDLISLNDSSVESLLNIH